MGKWIHKLSDINVEEKTANCSNCGIVKVHSKKVGGGKFAGGKYWSCAESEKNWTKIYRSRIDRTLDRLVDNGNPEHKIFIQLFRKQKGQCAICKVEINKSAHLDHCHITGDIRGLLCRPCNVGIGYFEDNPELLALALKYLLQN